MPGSEGPGPDRRRIALVTTTINVPTCLERYVENAQRHGHAERLSVVVVGDRKTPAEAGTFLADLARRSGCKVAWLDMPAQAAMLRRWPALDVLIRANCIQRRNVGYLQAAMDGADVIVSVDDDNFVNEGDYFGAHLVVGGSAELPVVSHDSGWWNICERLESEPPRRFYHRGFPKSRQTFERWGGERVARATVRPVVSAGLWLNNPDVDATAHIEEPIKVARMKPFDGADRWALAAGTWCPFNSQNTAFDVKTLAAMYLVVMLDVVRGFRIGRLDDIWMSYFLRAIADRLGDSVVYGAPLVTQDRNVHNFVRDLSEELSGYVLTEWIVERLRSFATGEKTYTGAYRDLVYHLKDGLETDAKLEAPEREYLRAMVLGMGVWLGAVADVQGGSAG